LTGVEVTGEMEIRPAIAIKIENSVDARPQTGLEDADMVWEEMVEGGIPRYVAVYHSVIPEEVGPIRSVRPMDPAIAAPLRGLMAFSGGQGQFVSRVSSSKMQIVSADRGDPGFYRVDWRYAPHNTYGNPAKMLKHADKRHQDPPEPQFVMAASAEEASAVTAGTEVEAVDVQISSGSRPLWEWDADGAVWNRFEGSNKAMNAKEEQLTATNVIGLMVEVGTAPGRDPAGNPIPETYLTKKKGKGFIASGGKVLEVKWSKGKLRSPVVLTDKAGNEVTLVPGRTWIELIPINGGSWEMKGAPEASPSATPSG